MGDAAEPMDRLRKRLDGAVETLWVQERETDADTAAFFRAKRAGVLFALDCLRVVVAAERITGATTPEPPCIKCGLPWHAHTLGHPFVAPSHDRR